MARLRTPPTPVTPDEATAKAIEAIEQAQAVANDGRVDDSKALCIVAAEWRLLAASLEQGDATPGVRREDIERFLPNASHVPSGWEDLRTVHIVTFGPGGWTMGHPLTCKPAPYTRVADRYARCEYEFSVGKVYTGEGPMPDHFGRWKVTHIDEEGLPSLERVEW